MKICVWLKNTATVCVFGFEYVGVFFFAGVKKMLADGFYEAAFPLHEVCVCLCMCVCLHSSAFVCVSVCACSFLGS